MQQANVRGQIFWSLCKHFQDSQRFIVWTCHLRRCLISVKSWKEPTPPAQLSLVLCSSLSDVGQSILRSPSRQSGWLEDEGKSSSLLSRKLTGSWGGGLGILETIRLWWGTHPALRQTFTNNYGAWMSSCQSFYDSAFLQKRHGWHYTFWLLAEYSGYSHAPH